MQTLKSHRGSLLPLFCLLALLFACSRQTVLSAVIYEPYLFETIAGNPTNGTFADGTNSDAHFPNPVAIAVDSEGILYVTDYYSHVIRKITPVGTNWVTTTILGSGLAGSDDGTNASASFNNVNGIVLVTNGTFYITDTASIRRIDHIDTNWVVSTLISNISTTLGSVAVDSKGRIFSPDRYGNVVYMFTNSATGWVQNVIGGGYGISDGTNSFARFNAPDRIVADSADNLYVSDYNNDTIRKLVQIGTNWVVTTVAGKPTLTSFADGPGTNSLLGYPEALGVDAARNVYIGDTYNNAIRKLSANGTVTTLGGSHTYGYADGIGSQANIPSALGIAVDNSGTLYIAQGAGLHTIRRARRACGVITNSAPLKPAGFKLSGIVAAGIQYRLQASSNMIDWKVLSTFTPASGTFQYQEFTSSPARVYRLSCP